MVKIELECKHCGTTDSISNLPFRLGNWLIHRGKDVFCSLACVTAYSDDLRSKMQEEAREESRMIVWSSGSGLVSTLGAIPAAGVRVPPAQGGAG